MKLDNPSGILPILWCSCGTDTGPGSPRLQEPWVRSTGAPGSRNKDQEELGEIKRVTEVPMKKLKKTKNEWSN